MVSAMIATGISDDARMLRAVFLFLVPLVLTGFSILEKENHPKKKKCNSRTHLVLMSSQNNIVKNNGISALKFIKFIEII